MHGGGAVGESRTPSLRDTNALLRQLSYDSKVVLAAGIEPAWDHYGFDGL